MKDYQEKCALMKKKNKVISNYPKISLTGYDFSVGEQVEFNIGTLKNHIWCNGEVIWIHPGGTHLHLKMITHVENVRKRTL